MRDRRLFVSFRYLECDKCARDTEGFGNAVIDGGQREPVTAEDLRILEDLLRQEVKHKGGYTNPQVVVMFFKETK